MRLQGDVQPLRSKNKRAVDTGALGRPRARLAPRSIEETRCPTRQASLRRAWGELWEGNTFSRKRPSRGSLYIRRKKRNKVRKFQRAIKTRAKESPERHNYQKFANCSSENYEISILIGNFRSLVVEFVACAIRFFEAPKHLARLGSKSCFVAVRGLFRCVDPPTGTCPSLTREPIRDCG